MDDSVQVGCQIGGGRRRPSPPPLQTPAKLRPRPILQNRGVTQKAGRCKGRLVESDAVVPSAMPALEGTVGTSDASSGVDHDARLGVPITDHPRDDVLPSPNTAPGQSVPPDASTITPSLPSTIPELPSVSTQPTVPSGKDMNLCIDHVLLTNSFASQAFLQDTQGIPRDLFGDQGDGGVLLDESNSSDVPPLYYASNAAALLSFGNNEPSTPSSGRHPTRVNALLNEGYEELEQILNNLMSQTSLTAKQVVDGWHKSRGRPINGTNRWNLYKKYFAKHEEQERPRLGLPVDAPSKRC